ncbi:MAG: IS91 family transposase [bacterium]|nr:IS91 family transposase [bacterium]
MSGAPLEVAEIFRRYCSAYEEKLGPLSAAEQRVVHDIISCRTADLGGHLYVCDECGVITERFNSCRNRHCPKCQRLERERWLEKRLQELLPVPYFHLVFTVPHQLNPLFLTEPKTFYNLLFRTTADTLLTIAADPKHLGAMIGFSAHLHSWGQRVDYHPHLHVIAPGGGLSPDRQRWIASRRDFFLPVKVLSRVFRGKFLDQVGQMARQGQQVFPRRLDPKQEPSAYRCWLEELYAAPWVVYSKPPFGGAERGLQYLARYTHRVAISNDRLRRLENDRVVFDWKDYRDDGQVKAMSLDAVEFLGRFLMHVLPSGFHRIRYYGLLANRHRAANLERCRYLLGVRSEIVPDTQAKVAANDESSELESWEERMLRLTGIDPTLCQA